MEYQGVQLSAMTALAILASAIDGECDDREMGIIFVHLGCFVPDEKTRKSLIAVALTISFENATQIVRQMSIQQKRHFCAFIGVIILADGVITNSELEYWRALTLAADLPIMTIQEAAEIFSENMGLPSRSSSSYSSSSSSYSSSSSSSSSSRSSSSSDNDAGCGCAILIVIGFVLFMLFK